MNSWLQKLISGKRSLSEIQADFFQEDREPNQKKAAQIRADYLKFLEKATPAQLEEQRQSMAALTGRKYENYEGGGLPSALQWWNSVLIEEFEKRKK